jgi:hypothetical protein
MRSSSLSPGWLTTRHGSRGDERPSTHGGGPGTTSRGPSQPWVAGVERSEPPDSVGPDAWLAWRDAAPLAALARSMIKSPRTVRRFWISLRWKRPFADQHFPPCHEFRVIDLQDGDRGSPDAALRGQVRAIPCEMPFPTVLSGMEEPHDPPGLRVHPGDVRPLEAVAKKQARARFSAVVGP